MTVTGLHHVAIRVDSLDDAIEHYGQIGLPVISREHHPVTNTEAAVLGVGQHRILLVASGDHDATRYDLTPGPFAYLSLRTTDDTGSGDIATQQGLFGPGRWLTLPFANSAVELLSVEPAESVVGATGLWRIESIPWSVSDRAAATAEAGQRLGLTRSEADSDLVFPDLHSTNSLLFVGDDSYVDFNEPTDPQSPTARRLASSGNGAFALVLEPSDFDATVAALRERHVPTVTPDPVDLRVVWRDGTTGSAARIISLDRAFTGGARIFVSEPTFPW
jgi:catechol 2,3-dioxygenase-like lactoylglutathione lyase family enzyme